MKKLLKKGNLKIRYLSVFMALSFLFFVKGHAQTFQLSDKGDTLNLTDKKGLKQGKWINHVDELRGEPGFEEEGRYKDGKKEGSWRIYDLSNNFIGLENYRFGGKDGTQQYFTSLGDLIREEGWRGYNPDAPYDTIDVYGTGSNEIIDRKIVKAQQYSVKHGEWKFFEPGSGKLIKVEEFDRGFPKKQNIPVMATTTPVVDKPKKVEKTPAMLEWEKKNSGKKKAVRDGRTGG
jgi:hypothetical protein